MSSTPIYDSQYRDSLMQEILTTVYYYHNKIDNLDLFTVGCELSEWDGERVVELLKSNTKEDIMILNTCAVTDTSQKASEVVAKALRYIYPNKKFYITGCGVDYNEDYYKQFGITLKNDFKFDCKSYGKQFEQKLDKNFKHNLYGTGLGLVKIQDGCHNHCTYCIINKLRNNPYSIPYSDIKEQIQQLISIGKTRIELLGTELCFYNSDNMKLSDVCRKIIEDFPQIQSLHLGALDPASREVEKLMDLVREYPNKMSNVLVLSIQSMCDDILHKMKRRHNMERIRKIFEYAKPDIFFEVHIIPGFPGETEEQFQETMQNLRELRPIYIHAMAYSARPGTEAAEMPQNNDYWTIKRRESELEQLMFDFMKDPNYPVRKEDRDLGRPVIYRMRMEHYPKETDTFIEKDLYKLDNIKEIFEMLDPSVLNENIVFMSERKEDYDDDVIECYNKMIAFMFNCKIIERIHLTEKFVLDVLSKKFNIDEWVVDKCAFIEFLSNTDKIDEKLFKDFILHLYSEKLYDIKKLSKELKANNSPNSEQLETLIDALE